MIKLKVFFVFIFKVYLGYGFFLENREFVKCLVSL